MRTSTTALFRCAAIGLGLTLSLCGCGSQTSIPMWMPCLSGPVPHVGRPAPDDMFALLRRERERAASAPPLVRARILEAIPDLFPDTSDTWPDPPCHDELEKEGIDALRMKPLVFDRELVARVRAVHDAPPLVTIALAKDGDLAEYRLGADEPGPAPSRAFLRYRALANIPSFWIADNRVGGRALLLDRLRVSTDPMEQLLIHGAAEAIFDQALWGHPAKAVGTDGPELLGGFIADVGKRLQGSPDPATLEIALVRLSDAGFFAVRFGHESAARGLVKTILDAKGDVPLTHGVPGAARDLAERARMALFDLDTPQEHVGGSDPPLARRKRFDPRKDWLDKEPAAGAPKEADRLARVKALDEEMGVVKYNVPKCYLLEQLGEWLSPAEMAARFDGMVAETYSGDVGFHLSTESLCRLRTAFDMEGAPEQKRIALALRLFRAPRPTSWDHRFDEMGPAIAWPMADDQFRQTAAGGLDTHLEWIDHSEELRTWLEQRALEPIPTEYPSSMMYRKLERAFDHLVAFHLSGAPGASPDVAKGLVRTWIATARDAVRAPPAPHVYFGQVRDARIRALGEYGRAAGLRDEAAAFLQELPNSKVAVAALYMLDLETPGAK
ncbi:MAG: hypothetical protein U0441_26145 [Polyangiaceae bacterium]